MIEFIRSLDRGVVLSLVLLIAAMGWLFLFPPKIGGDEP